MCSKVSRAPKKAADRPPVFCCRSLSIAQPIREMGMVAGLHTPGAYFVPIVEHTSDRLKVRSISVEHAGALASFDRGKNSVVVYSLALLLPFRRDCAPLSEITAAQVRKRERDNGTASYGIVLRRQRGEDIAFSSNSRDDAMHTMHEIVKFLNLE